MFPTAPPRLLSLPDLPPWMRDNDYLLSHYRAPHPSLTSCLLSAFLTMHNDSVNIWSHFLGFLLFATLSFLSPFLSLSLLPLLVSASLCMFFSFTFHALWIYSPRANKTLQKLDFVGISLLCCGHAITGIHHLFYCNLPLAKPYYLTTVFLEVIALMAIFSPFFATPNARHVRVLIFSSLGACVVVPLIHAGILHQWTDDRFPTLFTSALTSLAVYFCGAVIYVVRFPECCQAGKYDCWGASHQILHVAVVLGCFMHFAGVWSAVLYRSQVGCQFSPLT